MTDTTPSLQLECFLPYRAARLASLLSRSLAAEYRSRYQISVPEWRVLVHLMEESEISVRDIKERVDMDRARITRAVQRLDARGLVLKVVNERDRRLVSLALTPSGRDLAVELSQLAMEFERRVTAVLPPGNSSELLAMFERIESAVVASTRT